MHCRCVSYLEAVWVLGLELCLRAPAVQESKANGWEGTAGQDVVWTQSFGGKRNSRRVKEFTRTGISPQGALQGMASVVALFEYFLPPPPLPLQPLPPVRCELQGWLS